MFLIDPQSMETLPDEGEVFVEWQNPVAGDHYVCRYDVFNVRFEMPHKEHGTFLAWSHTATTKEPT